MTEKFLQYAWKMKLLPPLVLKTTCGEKITILNAGSHNTDSGPDFTNAKIKIGETTWAGNVEIHIHASDWKKHHHEQDRDYDNIILHAVYENDERISRPDGSVIPTLEMKDGLMESVFESYSRLMQNASGIPCKKQLLCVPVITIQHWMHRLMIERLEEKTQPILQALQESSFNWEETFYQFLARAFGARVNAEPFSLLAKSIPVKILAKHKNNLMQLEALLFGCAGFLHDEFADDYPNQLKKEFSFLQAKYQLQPLKKHLWKFLRLRPANFPTVRLAQFAQLIFNSSHLFSKILETTSPQAISRFFEVLPSAYWTEHYRFDTLSVPRNKRMGDDAIELLLINTITPFLFVYGKLRDEPEYINRAFQLLERVPAEKNEVILQWKEAGIKPQSAFESQALLQLKNVYCKNYRCLECAIGHKILSGSPQ